MNQSLIEHADSCMLCKRMIINAGIIEVVVADIDDIAKDPEVGYGYRIIKVSDWVKDDERLGIKGHNITIN